MSARQHIRTCYQCNVCQQQLMAPAGRPRQNTNTMKSTEECAPATRAMYVSSSVRSQQLMAPALQVRLSGGGPGVGYNSSSSSGIRGTRCRWELRQLRVMSVVHARPLHTACSYYEKDGLRPP
jgi:hypothetical protein